RERIEPGLRPGLDQAVARSAAALTELQMDFPVNLPQSGERWMTVRSTPRREADGSVSWYGVVTDITERKRTERRLHDRDALLRSLGRNMPGAIYKLVSRDGGRPHLEFISERAAELFELEPCPTSPDWSAQYSRIHPDDVPMIQRLTAEALKPGA